MFAQRIRHGLVAVLVFTLSLLAGCSRSSKAPVPLTAAELPRQVDQAFQEAAPPLRDLAKRAAESFQGTNYPQALMYFQSLMMQKELTKKQRDTATRAWLTVNEQLAAAQSQGDPAAKQILDFNRSNK